MSTFTPGQVSSPMSSPMSSPIFSPDAAHVECRSVLADGRVLTITASRRLRANRADVKCTVPGAPAIGERMQEVVRLARHTETCCDSRDQVVLSMDLCPEPGDRDWELAAVLADRMVRGLYAPVLGGRLFAQGWSDVWHCGRVQGATLTAARCAPAGCTAQDSLIIGGAAGECDVFASFNEANHSGDCAALYITHLGALSGHADLSAGVATVRTWFPLHSGGINDSLCWVEVSVFALGRIGVDGDVDGGVDAGNDYPAVQAAVQPAGTGEEDSIAVPGLDPSAQWAVRQTLVAARHFDGRGLGRWRSVVRFGQPQFQGTSYQLALVMADRLARGREFVPRGRLIASGCSSAWHAGRVDSVDGQAAKLALILRLAGEGDRILLPLAWQAALPAGYAQALRANGASLVCIDRIGMI